jgi:hypothetical protein
MTITTKNFSTKLSAFLTSTKTQRDNLQALIVFGLTHYRDHGDATYLSRGIQGCIGVKSLPTNTIKNYIKAQANLRLEAGKDGAVFKKEGKEVEVTLLDVAWYEWEGADHQAKPDVDAMARVKTLVTTLAKAIKEGTVKEGQEVYTAKLLAALRDLDNSPE